MNLQHPIARYNLQLSLLELSDKDYQQEAWVRAENDLAKEYHGYHFAMEALLDNVIWQEGEKLIGAIFRNKEEYEACLKVFQLALDFEKRKPKNLLVESYIKDKDWLLIVAAARNALRIMNAGDY